MLTFALLITLWAAWRIWKFTILPMLKPNAVKELPYWIPFIGHAVALYNDVDGTISYGRQYFGNNRETFSLTVVGKKIYIMTSAQNVGDGLKSLQLFDNSKPKAFLMKKFGISDKSISFLFDEPDPIHGNKSMGVISDALIKKQLTPGSTYDEFEPRFLHAIECRMRWDTMTSKATLPPSFSDKSRRTVSLLKLVQQTLVESTTVAFFGSSMLDMNPGFLEAVLSFDKKLQMFLHIPKLPWTTSVELSMQEVHQSVVKYLEAPKDSRSDAVWLIRTLEDEFKLRDVQTADVAGWFIMLFWAMNTNTWRLAFWVTAYLVNDPDLVATIRTEVSPIVNSKASMSSLHNQLAHCKLFTSLYYEVIRLVDSPISVRELTRAHKTPMGEALPKGATVMLAHRQLLMDEQVWGSDAKLFDPERFINNEDLLRNKSFTPFGGGALLCPGRFLARGEIMVFVALLIERFDAQPSSSFPRLDRKLGAGVGILSPVEGDDLVLEISRRG